MSKTIRLHTSPDGLIHATDESLDYLDERGVGYPSKAEAMRDSHRHGYTHVVDNGERKRIPARYRRTS